MARRNVRESGSSPGRHPALTAVQTRALDVDGYFVAPDALEAPTVAALLEAFAAAPAEGGTQHVEIGDDTPRADVWRALTRHPLMVAASEHVLGRPFIGGVHGRNPLPGFGQQGLHTDWAPWSARDPFMVVTAIFMLDAFTPSNGPTRIVPGSHRIAPLPKSLAQPHAHHRDEICVTGAAGSALVMNGHLWHSGTRNAGGGPRRCVQMVLRAK